MEGIGTSASPGGDGESEGLVSVRVETQEVSGGDVGPRAVDSRARETNKKTSRSSDGGSDVMSLAVARTDNVLALSPSNPSSGDNGNGGAAACNGGASARCSSSELDDSSSTIGGTDGEADGDVDGDVDGDANGAPESSTRDQQSSSVRRKKKIRQVTSVTRASHTKAANKPKQGAHRAGVAKGSAAAKGKANSNAGAGAEGATGKASKRPKGGGAQRDKAKLPTVSAAAKSKVKAGR